MTARGLQGGKLAAPNAAMFEKMKRQWELAADSMPQLICLLDRQGKVIRANRALERWSLGSVAQARGLSLHSVLHGKCADPGCHVASFWRGAMPQLLNGQRVKHESWDAKLARYLLIVIQPPLSRPCVQPQPDDLLAVATVEDVSELQAKEDRRVQEELRDRKSELRRLSAQHVTIRENERRRVAMDLHDGLGQSLNLLKLSIQETARRIEVEQVKNSVESLDQLACSVESIVGEVRRIAMDLRPSTLDDLGLLPTLSWFFREFQANCRALRVESEIAVTDADIPEPLKIAIYRIIQEAICNVLRHADASIARVRLYRDREGLHLTISDDGRGFNDGHGKKGLGLPNMKERAEPLGGRYGIESVCGKGTMIFVCWPAASLESMAAQSSAPA